MGVPGGPSNPWMPSGYQRSTSSRDSISVCFPIASPVAIPFRQARIRCSTEGYSSPCGGGVELERLIELVDVKVMPGDDLAGVVGAQFIEQHVFRIGSADASRIRAVIENQQSRSCFRGQLRQLTR